MQSNERPNSAKALIQSIPTFVWMMIVFAYLFVMILVVTEMVHISDNAGTAGLMVFGVPYIWMFWARYSRSQ